MRSAERARASSPLDAALDVFRMRQYFDVVVRARDVASAVTRDLRFVSTVRRGLLPLPFDRGPAPGQVFGPFAGPAPPGLEGRVAVVTTGGSGALASLVGVARAIAVNGFYPHDFEGEDATGWEHRPLSIVAAASQVRTSQQAQPARENIARLRAAVDTVLIEPVPYLKVAGTGFYEQFLDTSEWPEFMRAGRASMLDALEHTVPRRRRRGTR